MTILPIPRSPGINFIESQMVETCTITRDVLGVEDATLDPLTGELTDSGVVDDVIYSGKCLIKDVVTKDIQFEQGGEFLDRDIQRVIVPVEAVGIEEGDTFVITAVAHDNEDFLGVEMRVFQVQGGTHRVYRGLLVEKVKENKRVVSK